MWVDYRGSLSTVYSDGEISTCGWITEVHSVQSTMMGRSQHVGRLQRFTQHNLQLRRFLNIWAFSL